MKNTALYKRQTLFLPNVLYLQTRSGGRGEAHLCRGADDFHGAASSGIRDVGLDNS